MSWIMGIIIFITFPIWGGFLFILWFFLAWVIGMPVTVTYRKKPKGVYRWFRRIS